MILLVDDQLLSRVLRGEALPVHLATAERVFTTGCWYVRLCQAVLGVATRPGTLSGPFAALPPERHGQAIAALLELPEDCGLVSLRALAPVIGRLRTRHQLNILGMEALAATIHLKATVALSARSPRLEDALTAEGQRFELLG